MYNIQNDFNYQEMKRQEEQLIEMLRLDYFNLEKAMFRLERLAAQKEKVEQLQTLIKKLNEDREEGIKPLNEERRE